jgi:hypothetical protein
MNNIGKYTFLPWLRQGIAIKITAADLDPSVRLRATIGIELKLQAEKIDGGTENRTVSKDLQLYGPGDIVGLDSKSIIKTDPLNGITNFEPNYLAYIDFYDEDLPWRYTPAAPDTGLHRLRPWIVLVVLKEEEFSEGRNLKGKPLPFIKVENAAVIFPPADQLWAWAHVHVNRPLDEPIVSNNTAEVLEAFQAVLGQDADLAYSRIVCPRHLEPKTAYTAFLVPSFESGRLAGIGADPAGTPHATTSAWESYEGREAPAQFPYYHCWAFRTGDIGDFEYLVRLLEPKPVDSRVGRRDMDVQRPGSNLPGIDKPELGGILKLGGALKIPFDTLGEEDQEDVLKYDNWATPYPQEFQEKLAELINLADDYEEKTAAEANMDTSLYFPEEDPDPLITPPLYARWHALTQRLLWDRNGVPLDPDDNWVHDLNLDPRWRVAAGFGTRVVQQNQEEYMDAAWGQLGDVLEANRRIRQAQLAKEISWVYYDKHLRPLKNLNTERTFVLTTPVQKRIVAQDLTVFHQVETSRVTTAAASVAMRRIARPRARLMQSLEFSGAARPENLLTRINEGAVSAAPPKETPEGIPTLDKVSEDLLPDHVPDFLIDLLRDNPWLRFLPLILMALALVVVLLLFLTGAGMGVGAAIMAGLFYLYRQLSRLSRRIEGADSVAEENQTPELVDRLPRSPDFRLADLDEGFKPSTGRSDSPVAGRFKTALRDAYSLLQTSAEIGEKPERPKIDLPRLTEAVFEAVNPERTVPARTFATIYLPPRIIDFIGEEFVEAMAYPEFDIPMYKPLADLSSELFLPNINYIEQNSISLLETNQRFIESYMVGLNHEFGRELLWREYVTDQRGSYFRQFWDVSSYFPEEEEDLDEEALREKLRDIPPLHRWSKSSDLGDHDHREMQGDKEEEVVLVIRGELLKKYPTAVIYAHRARWQTKEGSDEIDKTKPRDLVALTEAEEANPPRSKIRTPLYEAKVDPDIYFFGFDLTAEEAKGEDDDPGWFFVIKERPGEPRFGLDLDKIDNPHFWNDLSWEDTGVAGGQYLVIGDLPDFNLTEPPEGLFPGSEVQHEEDVNVSWRAGMNAAELAYILYQVPVLVGVHASEMLPK